MITITTMQFILCPFFDWPAATRKTLLTLQHTIISVAKHVHFGVCNAAPPASKFRATSLPIKLRSQFAPFDKDKNKPYLYRTSNNGQMQLQLTK